jgi:four helix bundle protein
MDHKEMDVWKSSIDLVEDIYRMTDQFPKTELYGLVSQMRRAAISVPSNISEGAARESGREFGYFLNVAMGSASELETQLIISERLGYAETDCLMEKINKVKALIMGLKNYIKRDQRAVKQRPL